MKKGPIYKYKHKISKTCFTFYLWYKVTDELGEFNSYNINEKVSPLKLNSLKVGKTLTVNLEKQKLRFIHRGKLLDHDLGGYQEE